jgi:respiratory burst oxidase
MLKCVLHDSTPDIFNIFWMVIILLICMQLWQLETLLLQKDTYLNYSQALSYTSQALSQNLQGLRKKSPIRRMSRRFLYYLQENWRRIWVLTLWVCIMIGLFMWKFFQYKKKDAFHVMGYCLLTAKGAAETLKFNMALILFPVCRNTITWLRSTKLSYVIPFDDNINFHKVRIHTTRKPETILFCSSVDISCLFFHTLQIYN